MNVFFFDVSDAIPALWLAFGYGIVLGFVLALLRMIVFTFIERSS